MKKMATMLLSLTMCLSLAVLPAQATFISDFDNPIIIDVGGNPAAPGDDNSNEPGNTVQVMQLPEMREEFPVD